jgi:hypothetical protein
MEFEPDGSVEVPKLAMPPFSGAVPNTVVPFLNVTVLGRTFSSAYQRFCRMFVGAAVPQDVRGCRLIAFS